MSRIDGRVAAVGRRRDARGRRPSSASASATWATGTSASSRAGSSSACSSPARCSGARAAADGRADHGRGRPDAPRRHAPAPRAAPRRPGDRAHDARPERDRGAPAAARLPEPRGDRRRPPAEVITPDVLERTYGAPMEVLVARRHARGRRALPRGEEVDRTVVQLGSGIMDTLLEPFRYEFFRNGITIATLAGALCGLVGVYVVLRGMSYIGHGLSHAIFGGAAASFALGVQLLPRRRAIGGLASALLITADRPAALDRRRRRDRRDHLGGVRASGIVDHLAARGVHAELEAALFGNVLGRDRPTIVVAVARRHVATRRRRVPRTGSCCSRRSIPRSPTVSGVSTAAKDVAAGDDADGARSPCA